MIENILDKNEIDNNQKKVCKIHLNKNINFFCKSDKLFYCFEC